MMNSLHVWIAELEVGVVISLGRWLYANDVVESEGKKCVTDTPSYWRIGRVL